VKEVYFKLSVRWT